MLYKTTDTHTPWSEKLTVYEDKRSANGREEGYNEIPSFCIYIFCSDNTTCEQVIIAQHPCENHCICLWETIRNLMCDLLSPNITKQLKISWRSSTM